MPDIRTLTLGEGCMRTRYEADFGDKSTNAGVYLLMHAIEAAGLPDSVDTVIEESAATFLHSGMSGTSIGGVGYCGRKIGLGTCGIYGLDREILQIVPKPAQQ